MSPFYSDVRGIYIPTSKALPTYEPGLFFVLEMRVSAGLWAAAVDVSVLEAAGFGSVLTEEEELEYFLILVWLTLDSNSSARLITLRTDLGL
jgi:hypothetical protein